MSKIIRPFLYSAAVVALGLTAFTAYVSADNSETNSIEISSATQSTMTETAALLNDMMPAAGDMEAFEVAEHHMEEAVEDAKDAMEDAAEAVEDAATEAAEEASEAVEEATEAAEEHGEDMHHDMHH